MSFEFKKILGAIALLFAVLTYGNALAGGCFKGIAQISAGSTGRGKVYLK